MQERALEYLLSHLRMVNIVYIVAYRDGLSRREVRARQICP